MTKEDKIKTWAYLMRIGNRCGCHQREDRSFYIKGWQFPVCSRCTGILLGQIIGITLYLFKLRINMIVCMLFLIIMFFDWFIQFKNIKESTNFRRFVTGNFAGIAQIAIVLNVIIYII